MILAAGAVFSAGGAALAVGEAASSGSQDWVQYLLQGGPFALILVLILTDKLAPTGERNRLREENAQNRKDIQELNDKLLALLPPLTEAASVITRVGDLMEAMHATGPPPPRQNQGRGR